MLLYNKDMTAKIKAFIVAVVFGLGSLFGYSAIGPFTALERARALDLYERHVQTAAQEKLSEISSYTKEHTVGYEDIAFESVNFAEQDFFLKSYNLVLEITGTPVMEYEIKLKDGTLSCKTPLSAYAVFSKDHGSIKLSSFILRSNPKSECTSLLAQPTGQNH